MNKSHHPHHPHHPHEKPKTQGTRELIESFVVALILAFLFKSFVAEVFVIPTGSMAPTLMGAHKDVTCPECGHGYQAGASSEYIADTGAFSDRVVIGTTCPLCRYRNDLDLRNEPNQATFTGDRIVVGKFNYLFNDPQRWDVIVFKYPRQAQINYIKRLVGKPGEELRIRHGDVYIRENKGGSSVNDEPFVIARKPPHKILPLLQPVYDSAQLPQQLLEQGWPSSWQNWPRVETGGWKVNESGKSFEATLETPQAESDKLTTLRYFHKFAGAEQWNNFRESKKIGLLPDPYSSTLITDFACYNAVVQTTRGAVYQERGGFRPDYRSGLPPHESLPDGSMLDYGQSLVENDDGNHWIGDLAYEVDLELNSAESGKVILDLVEAGVRFQCAIDLKDGMATLQILKDGQPISGFENEDGTVSAEVKGSTGIRAGSRNRLRFANIDDQLVLWVNGGVIKFSGSTAYDSEKLVASEKWRPYWTPEDPLDSAPAGIALADVAGKVHRLQVWRDVYYIAIPSFFNSREPYVDFDWQVQKLLRAVSDEGVRSDLIAYLRNSNATNAIGQVPSAPVREQEVIKNSLAWIYSTPQEWATTDLFSNYRSRTFKLKEGQFFPMGDNSAASFDARNWEYVPRELLIGKALVLLWPHPWNRPIPFLPNVGRMGLIR